MGLAVERSSGWQWVGREEKDAAEDGDGKKNLAVAAAASPAEAPSSSTFFRNWQWWQKRDENK